MSMASKRRLRRKQCEGKRKFADAQEATAFLKATYSASAAMNSYHCGFCRSWHLGHLRRRDRDARQRLALAS